MIALSLAAVLLPACSVSVKMNDDESDDTVPSEQEMMEEDAKMEEDTTTEDDGTVEGATHEDAGGDGTNTTGGIDIDAGINRIIYIEATEWMFTPSTITAKKGEEITLQIEAVKGTHGFAVPALGINMRIDEGEIMYVDLPTDTAGTFEGYCSVPCGEGHSDMKVTVVITE